MVESKWQKRFERERKARKEAEQLLENKSLELWEVNQGLEETIRDRTLSLQNALDTAKEANRSKDEFLSNISHEMRTPLNAIMGFVDVMLMQNLDEDKRKKYLNIMKTSGQNLLSIINDVLDFSKIQSGNFNISTHEVDLKSALINSCSIFNSQAATKKINYNYNFDDNIPQTLVTDETKVIQVLNNFISNAIKFTPEGGIVDVSCTFENNTLIAQVKDNGIGIEKEKHEIVFSPFEQEDTGTTREYGGTGLGLSISVSLIKMLGGSLIFESQKGKGSTFGFKMPMQTENNSSDKDISQDNASQSITQLKGHILVAEDNMANQMLIEALLEEFGLSFDLVEDGLEAIESTKQNSYDLILMDYNMPNLSGLDATLEIRKFNQTIPIIALSASVSKKDIENFLNAGMNDTIAKPIDLNLMGEVLQKFLKS